MPSLACVGTVKVAQKQDGSLAVYRGKNGPAPGTDKSGHPLLVIGLNFVPDPTTTAPPNKFGYTWYACLHPGAFDPNVKKTAMDAAQKPYQRDNYIAFMSLVDSALGQQAALRFYTGTYDNTEVTLNEDGTVTDNSDYQALAQFINNELDGKVFGFCIEQDSVETDELNENGYPVRRKIDKYVLVPHKWGKKDRPATPLFFAYDPDGKTKPPKNFKPTFAEMPF